LTRLKGTINEVLLTQFWIKMKTSPGPLYKTQLGLITKEWEFKKSIILAAAYYWTVNTQRRKILKLHSK
jgi:hypothetical protein